jgi:hypothetical protein
MTRKAEFYLYGKTPVMFMPLPDGYVKIAAYHDKFHEDGSYWADIKFDRDNLVQKISKAAFLKAILERGGTKAEFKAASQA